MNLLCWPGPWCGCAGAAVDGHVHGGHICQALCCVQAVETVLFSLRTVLRGIAHLPVAGEKQNENVIQLGTALAFLMNRECIHNEAPLKHF